KAGTNGRVFGVTATSGPATEWYRIPSVAPFVSFQKVELVACEKMPSIGIGTCWLFHCTVGWVPTCDMPVIITSAFSPSILLKIGVKSVVSGEKRMWSSTLSPAFGRQSA